MIELLVKNIIDNAYRIEDVAEQIKKLNKNHRLEVIAVVLGLYVLTRASKNNRERIIFLESQLKEMKSKGE